MCLFRDTARPQDSLHCAHLCTFFPVWIIMCVLRWPAWLNDLFPIIASRYLFRLNDIGWRTGKGINVTSYAESPGILSQTFYHKFRIWTRWHSVWRGSSQDVFWENRWVCSSYHNKNKKRIRLQALQKVGAVVAARELLYRIRCLKGQSLSRSCSTWSSQHKLGLKNRDVQNWFFFLQYINNQPSSIRRFFSLAWFLMSIRYMKNLRIIKSGIKYIIKNIYQTNLASFIPRHCVYLFIHAKVWVITYFVNKHQCKIRNAKNSKMPARTLEYLLHPALSTSRGHTILDNTFLCAPFW